MQLVDCSRCGREHVVDLIPASPGWTDGMRGLAARGDRRRPRDARRGARVLRALLPAPLAIHARTGERLVETETGVVY
jgi:hypothetical protein